MTPDPQNQNRNWNLDTVIEVFLWQEGRQGSENLWKARE